MNILATLISNYMLGSSAFKLNVKGYANAALTKSSIPTTQNNEQCQKVSQLRDPLSESPSLNKSLKETYEFLPEPKSGYSAIKRDVAGLIEAGYTDLDIMVFLGENHDKALLDRVVEDLRKKGLF